MVSCNLTGAAQLKRAIPLYGAATNIKAGAAVMRGTTDGTNIGYGIIAASTIATFVGVTESLFAAATLDNDPGAGTKYILTDVTINPFAVYEAEYDQTTGLAVASGSGTAPVVTSGENIQGGYLLGVTGPGVGQLSYVKACSSGTYTLKTAAAYTSASHVIKILPITAALLDLTTDGTAILGTTAAAGSGYVRVLENKVVAVGFDQQFLDPTKHDNITFATGYKLYAMIMFSSSLFTNHT